MPRVTQPDGRSQLLAIFGWPLQYTRSPAFQNAGLRAAGINAVYAALPAPDEASFLALARGLQRSPQFLGANVTNPYKLAALKLVARLSPAARAVGAVNTLVRGRRGWEGHNTDAGGFLAALDEARFQPAGRSVLILGAGGAARALAWACGRARARQVLVLARRPGQAAETARLAGRAGRASHLDAATVAAASGEASLVVNTLPGAALGARFGRALSPGRGLALDISYVPVETAFGKAARARGWRFQNGLPMLLAQGALAFTLWTGKPAPLSQMRAALRKI